jgi:hypothetical protein
VRREQRLGRFLNPVKAIFGVVLALIVYLKSPVPFTLRQPLPYILLVIFLAVCIKQLRERWVEVAYTADEQPQRAYFRRDPIFWDLRHLPLERRKERLETLVQGTRLRYSGPLPGSPTEIVPVLKDAGLEGVVAKRKDSIYAAGTRTTVWPKFRLSLSQEFVIGGYYFEKGSVKKSALQPGITKNMRYFIEAQRPTERLQRTVSTR